MAQIEIDEEHSFNLVHMSVFLHTDHNPGEADGVFEVGLVLVDVGEAGV